MLERMSLKAFYGWWDYFEVEPFGPPADYHRAGIVAAMVGNAQCPKDPPLFKETDWIPGQERHDEPMNSDQIKTVLAQRPSRRRRG